MTTEDFKVPASDAPPSDAGLDGAEVDSSLAPAPGGTPPSPVRGALPDVPNAGRAARPSATPQGGRAPQAPSPPSASTPAPLGDGGGEGVTPGGGGAGGSAPSPGPAPGGGDAEDDAAPSPGGHPAGRDAAPALAGQAWRDAVRKAQAAVNAEGRRRRAKPRRAAPGYQPGGNRREPGGGAS